MKSCVKSIEHACTSLSFQKRERNKASSLSDLKRELPHEIDEDMKLLKLMKQFVTRIPVFQFFDNSNHINTNK